MREWVYTRMNWYILIVEVKKQTLNQWRKISLSPHLEFLDVLCKKHNITLVTFNESISFL